MGKRGRRRSGGAGDQQVTGPEMTAPTTIYGDAEAGELELRGSLTPRARAEYTATLGGGLNREDAWQRATELLFERLAVSWTIAGVRTVRQSELLGRYRLASGRERQFVRDSLRAHLTENFPELQAP
jgi:hypothetical protein